MLSESPITKEDAFESFAELYHINPNYPSDIFLDDDFMFNNNVNEDGENKETYNISLHNELNRIFFEAQGNINIFKEETYKIFLKLFDESDVIYVSTQIFDKMNKLHNINILTTPDPQYARIFLDSSDEIYDITNTFTENKIAELYDKGHLQNDFINSASFNLKNRHSKHLLNIMRLSRRKKRLEADPIHTTILATRYTEFFRQKHEMQGHKVKWHGNNPTGVPAVYKGLKDKIKLKNIDLKYETAIKAYSLLRISFGNTSSEEEAIRRNKNIEKYNNDGGMIDWARDHGLTDINLAHLFNIIDRYPI